MNHRLNRASWVASTSIILFLLALLVAGPDVLQAVVAVPLVLFLPGFVLTFLLFGWEPLGAPERLVLSVGLSVSSTALIGLLLNWTPWGLQRMSLWGALLVVLVVEVVLLVFLRHSPWKDVNRLPSKTNFTLRQWVFLSLAAFMALLALQIARTPANQQGFEGYTTLWIQPSEVPDTLRLGVRSDEFDVTKYQIRFEVDSVVRQGPFLELAPGESWEGVLRLSANSLMGKPLTILLYRLDRPNDVYRRTIWWPETP
jgi:hypothetical protein